MFILSSCVGSIWTGASLVYDRHNVYKKLSDYHLNIKVNNLLAKDKVFECNHCVLDIAVFHSDVLIVGHLPNRAGMNLLHDRLKTLTGYRRLLNEVKLKNIPSNAIKDAWITAKIRSQIFADDSIDPNATKVITSDSVVYLMGDTLAEQADKVVQIARHTLGVKRVIRVFRYLVYQS